MSVRPIVITGEPVLHRAAALVTDFDDELRTLVEDMYETNVAANGVGLAAPQIGVGLRVFIWKMANDDGVPEQGHVINPTLTTSRIPQERPNPDEEPTPPHPGWAHGQRPSGANRLGEMRMFRSSRTSMNFGLSPVGLREPKNRPRSSTPRTRRAHR